MCTESAQKAPVATPPHRIEYACGNCCYRQAHSPAWCPRCGHAVEKRPIRVEMRFGLEADPDGLRPFSLDPET